jgi:hypothetical protein
MSDSIQTLLVRYLHQVFGERDPTQRTPRSRRYSIATAYSPIQAAGTSGIELEDAVVALQRSSGTMRLR